jgi:1,2-beta-oligoglucan phosphorylase
MKVTNPVGLSFDFSASGAVRSIVVDPIRIGMRPPSPFVRTGANIYLRKRGSRIEYTALLGPDSPSRFRAADGVFEAHGSWGGLDYRCVLQLASAERAWQWRVVLASKLAAPVELDLIYVQDVGLRANSQDPVNEYYVSQYLERRVFQHPQQGAVIACRQNTKESVGHPWLLLASAGRASSATTDGVCFYGNTFRATGEPEALQASALKGELAGESSVVALQEEPFVLAPAKSEERAFVATYLPDHPQASSPDDLSRLPALLRSFGQTVPPSAAGHAAHHRFQRARLLDSEPLSRAELEQWFGSTWRHVEQAAGQLLSFFADTSDGPTHVVLRAKEERVDRPHGHILQAKLGLTPDESVMSTTAFACGVFNSHLTQGNTNFSTLLSVCTNPATPALEGQRMFVELADGEYLLGVPSAFAIGLGQCTWIYKRGGHTLRVRTWTSVAEPRVSLALDVLQGEPVHVALTHQFDGLNGWTIAPIGDGQFLAKPRAGSMLAGPFPHAQFRLIVHGSKSDYSAHEEALEEDTAPSLFVVEAANASRLCMSFVGEVTGPAKLGALDELEAVRRRDCAAALTGWREFSRELSLSGGESGSGDVAAIREILPWYGMNALVHFLTPYGLEQFSGAAWGTRDVCQGPVELLLCQEKYAEAKEVLRILFSRQNTDGGWPQWWMFDSHRTIRADSAHGDVVYWCILALCSYIRASGDLSILEEPLPFFQGGTRAPVIEHVDRIIELVIGSFVPGTALVQFGGGDWNDSLQPVSKDLARRLISSWTVQMSYQAFSEYREICERAGHTQRAQRLSEVAGNILADFHRHLMKDGVVAGYGLVGADSQISVLLHPTDTTTGVRYSLLPMNRGVISGVFDKQQAERHQALIAQHLTGPDGARLMDRPLPYRGGPQTIFQRAESSTYFGREIGLMYVHEHLRFAEVQARLGKPEAFLKALRQAIPVDYQAVVPQGNLRQSNCYYSSSDVAFQSRYDADALYGDVVAGKTQLKGGWRVYSSGPGIYVALIVSRLLGLRVEQDNIIIDPVLTSAQDGLEAAMRFRNHAVTFKYRVHKQGFAPRTISINGRPSTFEREPNRYREGGAVIPLAQFTSLLNADINSVEIEI